MRCVSRCMGIVRSREVWDWYVFSDAFAQEACVSSKDCFVKVLVVVFERNVGLVLCLIFSVKTVELTCEAKHRTEGSQASCSGVQRKMEIKGQESD